MDKVDKYLGEEKKMAGWIAIYGGKKLEIKKDEAKDLWGAKQLAIKKLKVPKSKQGLLAIDVAYESTIYENKVEYKPIKSPKKPFFYKGKWYNRDEMKKMGMDKEASKAILKY